MVLGVIFSTKLKYNAGDESEVEKGGKEEEEEGRRSRVAVHVLIQMKATPKVAPMTKHQSHISWL